MYAAPEALAYSKVGTSVDVYALIMLELFMTKFKEPELPLKPEVPDDMPQRMQHLPIRCWDSIPA
jgi:hypothetical protein